MAFVGGCTTGLMLTDDFTKEQVRHTDDVDLIIHVVNYPSYLTLKQELSERGFKEVMEHNDPICAMRLGELHVDFMSDNEDSLNFGNCWYKMAWETADDYLIFGCVLSCHQHNVHLDIKAFGGTTQSFCNFINRIVAFGHLFNRSHLKFFGVSLARPKLIQYCYHHIAVRVSTVLMAIQVEVPGYCTNADVVRKNYFAR